MNANEKIKIRREQLGISVIEMANRLNITIDSYWDIEFHQYEILTIADVSTVKSICKILGLNIYDLFHIKCQFCENKSDYKIESLNQRNEIISLRRKELKMTQDELGDKVGFETQAIIEMENNPDYLESWSYELVEDLSKILDIPVQILLDIKCPICGK